jgi:hypothetical protein
LGVRDTELSLCPIAEGSTPVSSAESAVLSLYGYLFRRFNNIPDVYSSEWTNFGFSFCKNSDQRNRLAKVYLELAKSGASLGEVAHAWETSSLSQLMKARGTDLSFLMLTESAFSAQTLISLVRSVTPCLVDFVTVSSPRVTVT